MPSLHQLAAVPLHTPGNCTSSALPLPGPALPTQLVTYGCDTFDSCYPTRVGRHGTMLTKEGPLRVVSGCFISHCGL